MDADKKWVKPENKYPEHKKPDVKPVEAKIVEESKPVEEKTIVKGDKVMASTNVSEKVADIGKDISAASDKLHNLFKDVKGDATLIQSGVAQMVKQAYQALSDLEMAMTDITQRTKDAEKRIAAAEATK